MVAHDQLSVDAVCHPRTVVAAVRVPAVQRLAEEPRSEVRVVQALDEAALPPGRVVLLAGVLAHAAGLLILRIQGDAVVVLIFAREHGGSGGATDGSMHEEVGHVGATIFEERHRARHGHHRAEPQVLVICHLVGGSQPRE